MAQRALCLLNCQTSNAQCSGLFRAMTVLINYEGSFDQEVFPHKGCRGSQLDFVVSTENIKLYRFEQALSGFGGVHLRTRS